MRKFLAVLSVVLTSLGFVSILYFFASSVNEITSLGRVPKEEEVYEIAVRQLSESLLILVAGILGALLSSLILVFNKYRQKWYFWTMLILSFPFLFVPPVGTIAFFIIWIFLVTQREQFFSGKDTVSA
jgi:hypothetical protein